MTSIMMTMRTPVWVSSLEEEAEVETGFVGDAVGVVEVTAVTEALARFVVFTFIADVIAAVLTRLMA